MTREEYVNTYGITKIQNEYGETQRSCNRSIIFPNGWIASIIKNIDHPEKNAEYSVAMCDYAGYFDWSILNYYGADDGCFYCNTEEEVQAACDIIRNL